MEHLATPQSLLGCGVLCVKKIKKMTQKLKGFLELPQMKKLIEFTKNWKNGVLAIGLVHLFT